jgi:hypothetical protein
MKLGTGSRRVLLFGSLALTLAAVQWVDGNEEPVRKSKPTASSSSSSAATPAPKPARAAAPKAEVPAAELDLARLVRARGGSSADAFAPRNWEPPPRKLSAKEAAMAAAPPPPPPQAPPLPFVYVGMLADAERTTVFLSQGSRDIAVRTGETIDGTYRVDNVRADRIELTYLPLKQRQTLSLGTQ